jgi:nucleotide-binding universal stress UspA family protein
MEDTMLRHLLIPLDGSLSAERAIDNAKVILRPQGKITLLTVIHDGHVPIPETDASAGESPLDQLKAYLERMAMNVKLNGFEAEVEIREGEPAQVIADLAVKFGVEVIVMCTHGRSGLSRLFAGSVTSEVLNLTPCPVLVIPNRERERVKEDVPAGDVNPGLVS